MDVAAPPVIAERLHRRTMRRLIGALASLALAGALAGTTVSAPAPVGASASASVAASAGAARQVIARFVATLTLAQRAALPGPTGTGLRLGELTRRQRDGALSLVRSLVSGEAWAVLAEAMEADDALAAAGSGEGSDGYRLGLLEDAASGGAFLQFAGPQLAVNVLLREGELIVEPELIAADAVE